MYKKGNEENRSSDRCEDKHHRAGDDAEMCARLFLGEIKDAGDGVS